MLLFRAPVLAASTIFLSASIAAASSCIVQPLPTPLLDDNGDVVLDDSGQSILKVPTNQEIAEFYYTILGTHFDPATEVIAFGEFSWINEPLNFPHLQEQAARIERWKEAGWAPIGAVEYHYPSLFSFSGQRYTPEGFEPFDVEYVRFSVWCEGEFCSAVPRTTSPVINKMRASGAGYVTQVGCGGSPNVPSDEILELFSDCLSNAGCPWEKDSQEINYVTPSLK